MNFDNAGAPRQRFLAALGFGLACFLATPVRSASPPVVHVAGDGTGDYNCDGTSDQVEINAALDFVAADPEFTTVYLDGPNTYAVDEPIIISSETILTGDSTARVQLDDHVGWWTSNKPIIGQKNRLEWHPWGNEGDSISNVEIHGFEIDGGIQDEPAGDTYILYPTTECERP